MSTVLLGIVDGAAFGGSLRLVLTRPDRLAEAKAAVDHVISDVDSAASRFRSDSELTRLNRSAGTEVRLSPLLARALGAGLRGARLTRGAVDPTVGSAVRLAGYDRDFASILAEGPGAPMMVTRIPGWEALTFDERSGTVRIPKGVEIDLGATAKALAADMAAVAALEAAKAGGVLVSLGGDIAVAGEAPPEGWSIQAGEDSQAPLDDGEETISIRSGGIATSSTTVRRWKRGGVELHHIIDPATGLPCSGPWRTASVVAATCVDANIASTAAIVMGARAIPWLEANHLPARLVSTSGEVARAGGRPMQT